MHVLQALEAPMDESLGHDLRELKPNTDETPASFMSRAAGITAEYPHRTLREDDLEAAQQLLPFWEFNDARVLGSLYGIARRLGSVSMEQHAVLKEYRTPRRVVGLESGNILLLATRALKGSDLMAIFGLEQAGAELAATPEHTTTAETSYRRPEAAERTEQSRLVLDDNQKNVLWLLGLPRPLIADKLNITQKLVSSRLKGAQHNNGMTREELLTASLDEGRIDTGLLPEPSAYTLTEQEKKVVRHVFEKSAEIAKVLSTDTRLVSERTVGLRLTGIYKKMGIITPATRTQAFLVAKRDGLV